jgi:hypothetical protein
MIDEAAFMLEDFGKAKIKILFHFLNTSATDGRIFSALRPMT